MRHLAYLLLIVVTAAGRPSALSAQLPEADSLDIVEEARERQRDFERFRQSRIPVQRERENAVCDENIGRFCIWFGGIDGERFPAEMPEVGGARVDLIRFLTDANEEIADPWIIGQLVHYLVEARYFDEAERIATECDISEEWWCSALLGYTLHLRTEYVEAERAFRRAMGEMPGEQLDRWIVPRYILTDEGRRHFEEVEPEQALDTWELFWKLSDPLFLFDGNDRLTDHLARLVQARNRSDAEHPQGTDWDWDVEETLIRYGMNRGYSRTHDPMNTFSFGRLNDTRRVVGHHHPKSRGYLFPEEYLESPAAIPPESWITAPREARTWHAPLYAPEIRGLETQVGRFRRADEMLVVAGYRPTVVTRADGVVSAWGGPGGLEGDPFTALFLIPVDGGERVYTRGTEPEGVLTLMAWPGAYVSALEVVHLEERQAWRARQGVVQEPLVPGLVGVSDLMILREGAPLPDSLEEAIPDVRRDVRVRQGERFVAMWEVYGLRILEPIQVTVGFTRGRPGFLQPIGDFVGVLEPDDPTQITFDDTGPDQVQTIFRSIELQLPDLDPGEYTLHLQLDLVGRAPIVASRPIIVEPA